jgi:hypothetical protein
MKQRIVWISFVAFNLLWVRDIWYTPYREMLLLVNSLICFYSFIVLQKLFRAR